MDEAEAVRTQLVTNLCNEHLKLYGVAIVPLDDETDGLTGLGGSGVAVQIGHRKFVATAAHVLTVPNERLTLLSLAAGDGQAIEPGGIVRRGTVNDPSDIAYLELGESLASRLGCGFFPLDRIRPHLGRRAVPAAVMLHGYPGKLREPVTETWLRAGAQGFITRTRVAPPEQPDYPDRHVFFEYPSEWTFATGVRDAPPAEGFSGGGLWLLNYLQTKLWVPQHAELVAIQTHWNKAFEWIRATEMQHWLELVSRDYEDLRPLIQDHIQSCASLPPAGTAP